MIIEVPGLNIQWPWSEMLLSGAKTVETRGYPLPRRLVGAWLAVIETPGRRGRQRGISSSVRGLIKFSGSKRYDSRGEWAADYPAHLVPAIDPEFAMITGRPKFGWMVEQILTIAAQTPPARRGIVYARPFAVEVSDPEPSLAVLAAASPLPTSIGRIELTNQPRIPTKA